MQPQISNITDNTVRVVDKSAECGLGSPFHNTPPSRAVFDLLCGHVWFGPVRLGYLSWGGGSFFYWTSPLRIF
jgi:hypothetical protein